MHLNQKLKKGFKPSYILFVFLLFFSSFLFAAPTSKISDIIPSEVGRIEKTHEGSNGKTIVLIQEAHVNYRAQKAISELLKRLIDKKFLRLVLVEGGWGNVSLSHLRNYGSEEGRLKVAEEYLKSGKISGEEYLDIISDLNMELWGIENPDLYRENMEAFLKFHEVQTKLIQEAEKLNQLAISLGEKSFSPKLQEFEHARRRYIEGQISIAEYVLYLTDKAASSFLGTGSVAGQVSMSQGKQNLSRPELVPTEYPNLSKLTALLTESQDFDQAKAGIEKENLIRALSKMMTRLEFDSLEVQKERKSLEEEVEFLNRLLKTRELYQKKLNSISVTNLKTYTKALENAAQNAPSEMFRELDTLEKNVGGQLAISETEKKFQSLIRASELVQKLFQLNLNGDEFEKIDEAGDMIGTGSAAGQVFGSQSKQNLSRSEPVPAEVDFESINQSIPLAKAFYISARKREASLIQNAIQKINDSGESSVAILAGGFHSEHLAAEFQKLGYSLYVLSPRFEVTESENSDEKYFEILKYKWDSRTESPANSIIPPGGIKTNEARS